MRLSFWILAAAALSLTACEDPAPQIDPAENPNSVRVGNCNVTSAVINGDRVYVAMSVNSYPCAITAVKP